MEEHRVRDEVARGIAREKTTESVCVILTLIAAGLAWAFGEATTGWLGALALVAMLVGIWKLYTR